MAPTTSKSAKAKPYDRPEASKKSKGKGKAPQDLGAPATHSQSSRKGKKAWRKNIDIRQEEEALEQAREDERITGGPAAAKTSGNLFTVDTVGDQTVAAKAKRQHKPLRSLAILDQKSAVPSLTSKISKAPAADKKQHLLSRAEKDRLKRIARKTQAFSDGTGLSSADIQARGPAEKDAWEEEEEFVVKGGFGEETIVKRKVKAPITIERQRELYLEKAKKVEEQPEGGLSYNPRAEAHQKLIDAAIQEELDALKREEAEAARLEKFGAVIEARRNAPQSEFAEGMEVGGGESDSEEEEDDDVEKLTKKPSKRKTTAQRNRQARQRALEAALLANKNRRNLANSVLSAPALNLQIEAQKVLQAEKDQKAKELRQQKEKELKKAGQKIGRHRVPGKRVEVQLGEDLAESLRQVKPEGNLFKDRFLDLQKRALIEPRVPQLPKKRSLKTKEYEKFAYKHFK
ncbi:hypothetical protein B9479_001745 [Cryptococcus floricola]|uniref:Ribosome biogenesis protein NOP53 n=1 Tax=Cryptococcus floricola TaxID=2591691 RepID=A0A5D3B480_9TREE|nr:hypothetical protein B9479_001745 [Cryptococcus floricola]